MSTSSKKRRAARAWMHKAAETFTKEGFKRGFNDGADRMRADMMLLLPRIDDRGMDPVTGKPHVRQIIKAFPDPYEHGPYYRVPMPEMLFVRPFADVSPRSARVRYVDFRPIRHSLDSEGMGGKATLEWFTWEPTEGSEEIGEHTSALFTGMGKLNYAASVVRGAVMYDRNHAGNGELQRASELIDECTEEFRRLLGRFAPIPNEDERMQRQRYLRRW